ncbi:MAG: PLP-dependent aminotransferase family protein [Desulforhopalus sp.]|nr:PLP-dependent aminotransferase family protein [Desulforhopalus sp.]
MTDHGVAPVADFHYRRLAGELAEQIKTGLYRAGDRLPSLRSLRARTGLSITTINQAYVELERQGLVEPREKSGYYVRPLLRNLPLPSQRMWCKADRPRKITIASQAEAILAILNNDNVAPFGAALPASQLLPAKQLAQAAQRISATYFKGTGLECGTANGVPALKKQIAGRAVGVGRHLNAEDIIITHGCMDAIQLCLRAVTKAGDIVVTESPTFTCYLQLLRNLGLLALEIPADPSTGIDLDILEKALQDNRVAACLVNPTFQNPLGFDMPAERKEQLVRLLEKHAIPLIEDDIFGELYFGVSRPPALQTFDRNGLVLTCSSFSKTLAPDFRVGWIIPGRFKEVIDQLKINSYTVPSKFPQLILADFLENGHYDRHLRKIRSAFRNQVSCTAAAIGRHFPEGTRLSTPGGGYILWVELDERVDGMELFRRAWDKKICVVPGAITTSSGRLNNCIRISCGHPFTGQTERAIETLGRIIAEYSLTSGNGRNIP